ncbi:kinase-like protein [Thelephora ganbajun]|uniref:Kinase-like protein n=1 Tax=Thelephora ganbajun TaxID=370292 RepID=A0ACB6Z5D0_THEGA|nr:kinase-like protein [Thelephora ganbajun]
MSLQRLYDLDRTFPDRLDKLLHDKEYIDELRGLPERELRQLVDHLNEVLVRLDRGGPGSSRKCLRVLRKICGFRKVLPTAYELPRDLLSLSQSPNANGGYCDAYEGTISVKVCIKRLRISVTGDQEKVKELFCKEAVVWKHLNHSNIVPFKGVTLDPLQLVSEWMPGGELRHYVRENPQANLINLSLGVAQGLAYLHSSGVIHGDLKGPNIMVDESGNARITDFGLAKIARGSNSLTGTSEDQNHTIRWTAPEILRSGQAVSKESDVFSFGMVMTEIFTGEVPFKTLKALEIVMRITHGERPGRPSHPKFTENLWELTQRCWTEAPQDRPKMEEVLKELSAF